MFFLKKNCVFLNYENNLNYLPISNKILFGRGNRQLYKTIKFFNVNTFIYLNMGKKLFTFNKLASFKLINISSNNHLNNTKIDVNLNLPNTVFYNYLTYIIVINLYLKAKN